MDLFEFTKTADEQARIDALRSQINVARATLRYRLDNQYSQAELGQLARTTQARVSELESMKGDPRLSTLGRVANALGCMIDMVPIPAASVTATPPGFNPVASRDLTVRAGGTFTFTTTQSKLAPRSSSLWDKVYG